jgi:hypothetical protein
MKKTAAIRMITTNSGDLRHSPNSALDLSQLRR